MNTPDHIVLLEKVTRRLAEAFQEVHQLCFDEIQRLKQTQQIEEEEVEEVPEPVVNPVQPVEPAENDTPEEVQKETKTKKIRKEVQEKTGQDKSRRKAKVVSHKPKAPASSFLLFFKQHQASISKTYPTYGVTELTKVAAKCWKELSNEQKQPFIKQCDEERKLYQQKMEKYRADFPQEIAEKARKNTKKQRKTSPNSAQKKEKESPVEDNNEQPVNGTVVAPEEYQSESQNNEEDIDSLGVV